MSEGGFELRPIGTVESPFVLRVHPRDDVTNPMQGVFSTRSADRPNPIGLHEVEIASIDGTSFRVRNLEAVDGTPIVDVKPVFNPG